MNPRRNLKHVPFTKALSQFDLGVLHEVGAIAHRVLAIALRATPDRDPLVFVREKVEGIVSALTFRIDEIVDRVSIHSAISRHFRANIGVIVSVPVIASFCQCH
jgi:hypothetical protein